MRRKSPKWELLQNRKDEILRLYRNGRSNRYIEVYLKEHYGESVSYRYIGEFVNEAKNNNRVLEMEREELLPEVIDEDDAEVDPGKIYSLLMNRIKAIAAKRHLSTRQIRCLVDSFTRLEAFKRQILNDSKDKESSFQELLDELKGIEKGELK